MDLGRRALGSALGSALGTVGGWPGVLLRAAGVIVALLLIYGYVQKVDRENEQRDVQRAREICGLIVMIDDLNQRQPAPTGPNAPDVVAYRAELHRYRLRLGCRSVQ